jgi:integrase
VSTATPASKRRCHVRQPFYHAHPLRQARQALPGLPPISPRYDLERGWLDSPRPKTGVPRRAWLWPEMVDALRVVLDKRHEPQDEENAALVFVTKYGESWGKITSAGPITKETRKLLHELGIKDLRNFYTLRHTFRTVADEAKDQPAVDYAMGHEVAHRSCLYRETISDERLRAVSEHVRRWLFPSLEILTAASD